MLADSAMAPAEPNPTNNPINPMNIAANPTDEAP
jgi:hypothetical protein